MADVALLAGVSLSTVGRVMNERGSVSDAKRRRVLEAARTLGLNRVLPSPVHGLLRFDLLMVDSPTDHFKRLSEAFLRQGELHRRRLVIQRLVWQEKKPEQLIELIGNARTPRQGLIVVAHDTPSIRAALTHELEKGVPVILLTSSLSGLEGATYIGVDNHVAGRTAGRLITQWLGPEAGRILLLTNSLLFQAHQERVQGFLEVIKQRAPGLVVDAPIECFDDDKCASLAVDRALKHGPEIRAIYNTGSGSAGIRDALLKHKARPVWLGHEANAQHARFLQEGLLSLVLDQDP